MDAKERMEKVLEYTGMNASSLGKKLGIPKYRIYDITQGRTQSIPYEIADKIKSCFTTLDRGWLLTGEGDMLVGGDVVASGEQAVAMGVNNGQIANSFNRVAKEFSSALEASQKHLTTSQEQTNALIKQLHTAQEQITQLIQLLNKERK